MSQINPLAFAYAQTPLAQRLQEAERDLEIRKAHLTEKSEATDTEDGDLFVDSTDAVDPVDDDTRRDSTPEREQRHETPGKEEESDETDVPHIDVQA